MLTRFKYWFVATIAFLSVTIATQSLASWNTFDSTYKAILPPKNENGQIQKWDTSTVTYSFVTAANVKDYPDDHPEKISPVPEETKGYVREILEEMYASVIPITFKEVPDTNDPKASANIRVMVYENTSGSYASAYRPKTYGDQRDGAVFLYSGGGDWKKGIGSAEYATIVHELGHAMGLKHPGRYAEDEEPPFLPLEMDNTINSVMSYDVDSNLAQEPSAWNWSLMAHDIAALQALYGANKAFQAGDTVYKFTGDGTSIFPFNGVDRQFKATQAIWDGGGNNSIDVSALPLDENGYYYDLRPGGQLTTKEAFNSGRYTLHAPKTQNPEGSADQEFKMSKFATVIGFGVQIKDIEGSSSSDEVIGNALDNRIIGNAGNDRLDGGAGNDWIEGGTGDDRLIASAGRNVLLGGAGDDIYQVGTVAGTRIIDSEGRDRIVFDRQPSLNAMMRRNADLIVDLNSDGIANPDQDLVIAEFFAESSIVSVGNWSHQRIANAFSRPIVVGTN
ncbi:M10 family metallopeptidase [Leptolyngbya sp. AN03gr2]